MQTSTPYLLPIDEEGTRDEARKDLSLIRNSINAVYRKDGKSLLERQSSYFHAKRVYVPHDKAKSFGPIFPDVKLKSVVPPSKKQPKKMAKSTRKVKPTTPQPPPPPPPTEGLDLAQATIAKEFNRQRMEKWLRTVRKSSLSLRMRDASLSAPF